MASERPHCITVRLYFNDKDLSLILCLPAVSQYPSVGCIRRDRLRHSAPYRSPILVPAFLHCVYGRIPFGIGVLYAQAALCELGESPHQRIVSAGKLQEEESTRRASDPEADIAG